MKLQLVNDADTLRIFEFERANKKFFSDQGIYRDQVYYQYNRYIEYQAKALEDQKRDKFYSYLILDDAGNIAGRLTLDDVSRRDRHSATLVLVIGEGYDRNALRDECVDKIVEIAKSVHGLTRLEAYAEVDNVSWQIALLKGGFRFAGKYTSCRHKAGSSEFTDVVLFEYNF